MKQSGQDKGTLLLALVAGLSINGTFAALFSSIVPFSVFPIISLVLTVYCLHQRYQNRTMPVGLPGLAAACFILGVLLYSTVVRAEYPDIGSNFFPAVLSVILVFIGIKMLIVDFYHIPIGISLGVVGGILTLTLLINAWVNKQHDKKKQLQ